MKENKLFFRLFIFTLFVLLVIFSFPAFKEMGRKNDIQDEIAALQSERQELEKNNHFLREKISYFETKEYKERISKERLNLQKKGERVVSVKFGPESNREVADSEKNESVMAQEVLGDKDDVNIPNYKKWWDYFFRY
ncbi:MAG: septum formation initiator family protein [Candidatus Moranbacteria bacterium]|nr:septum formation initiator family protein [Candidatus Moranbacteria bacterium]